MSMQARTYFFAVVAIAALLLISSRDPAGAPVVYAQTATAATEGAALKPGSTRVDGKGIEQVWVPAGCFQMGTDDFSGLEAPDWAEKEKDSEQPQHEVCLTAGYWIDKTEVTNASFIAFVDDGGYTKQEYWSEIGWTWLSHRDLKK